jgi:hypothetical protein
MSSRKEAYARVGSSPVGGDRNAEHFGRDPKPALSIDRTWIVETGRYRSDIGNWSSPPGKAKRLLDFREHEGRDLGVVFFDYADGVGSRWDGRADLLARASATGPTSFEVVVRRRSSSDS